MTIATELSALKQNLAAAKSAITEMGGVVSGAGAETLESEIKTIPKPMPAFGIVYYKESADGEVKEVKVKTPDEFNSLSTTETYSPKNWTATIGGTGNPVTVNSQVYPAVVGVTIGSEVEEIPTGFLNGCKYLDRELAIPDNIQNIGSYLLGNSNYNFPITPNTFPSHLTETPDHFLYGSDFNQTVELPNTIKRIGGYFLGSTPFDKVLTLPDSVEYIGDSFLSTKKDYTQPFTMPNSVVEIGGYFMLDGPVYYSPNLKKVGDYFGPQLIQQYPLPDSVEFIGDKFLTNTSIDSFDIVLPANLKSLGALAFAERVWSMDGGWDASITLPKSLEHVGPGFLWRNNGSTRAKAIVYAYCDMSKAFYLTQDQLDAYNAKGIFNMQFTMNFYGVCDQNFAVQYNTEGPYPDGGYDIRVDGSINRLTLLKLYFSDLTSFPLFRKVTFTSF